MCVLFVADIVLVLDNERLLIQLQQDLPSEAHILPLPKSAGVSFLNHRIGRGKNLYKNLEGFIIIMRIYTCTC